MKRTEGLKLLFEVETSIKRAKLFFLRRDPEPGRSINCDTLALLDGLQHQSGEMAEIYEAWIKATQRCDKELKKSIIERLRNLSENN